MPRSVHNPGLMERGLHQLVSEPLDPVSEGSRVGSSTHGGSGGVVSEDRRTRIDEERIVSIEGKVGILSGTVLDLNSRFDKLVGRFDRIERMLEEFTKSERNHEVLNPKSFSTPMPHYTTDAQNSHETRIKILTAAVQKYNVKRDSKSFEEQIQKPEVQIEEHDLKVFDDITLKKEGTVSVCLVPNSITLLTSASFANASAQQILRIAQMGVSAPSPLGSARMSVSAYNTSSTVPIGTTSYSNPAQHSPHVSSVLHLVTSMDNHMQNFIPTSQNVQNPMYNGMNCQGLPNLGQTYPSPEDQIQYMPEYSVPMPSPVIEKTICLSYTICLKAKEPKIDSELIYAYAKIDMLSEIEELILMPNIANIRNMGDRQYDAVERISKSSIHQYQYLVIVWDPGIFSTYSNDYINRCNIQHSRSMSVNYLQSGVSEGDKLKCLADAEVDSASFHVMVWDPGAGNPIMCSSHLSGKEYGIDTCTNDGVFWIWDPGIRATNMSESMLEIIVLQAQGAMTHHFTISDFRESSDNQGAVDLLVQWKNSDKEQAQ